MYRISESEVLRRSCHCQNATSSASNRFAAIAAAIVVGGLGLDLLITTMRGERSLLSRIGPLP